MADDKLKTVAHTDLAEAQNDPAKNRGGKTPMKFYRVDILPEILADIRAGKDPVFWSWSKGESAIRTATGEAMFVISKADPETGEKKTRASRQSKRAIEKVSQTGLIMYGVDGSTWNGAHVWEGDDAIARATADMARFFTVDGVVGQPTGHQESKFWRMAVLAPVAAIPSSARTMKVSAGDTFEQTLGRLNATYDAARGTAPPAEVSAEVSAPDTPADTPPETPEPTPSTNGNGAAPTVQGTALVSPGTPEPAASVSPLARATELGMKEGGELHAIAQQHGIDHLAMNSSQLVNAIIAAEFPDDEGGDAMPDIATADDATLRSIAEANGIGVEASVATETLRDYLAKADADGRLENIPAPRDEFADV